ncbi:MAG: sugar ABC transporter permease [Myxococcales bacterium]|nr:sugar ABC transporter permease [Myxococcales bacterium]
MEGLDDAPPDEGRWPIALWWPDALAAALLAGLGVLLVATLYGWLARSHDESVALLRAGGVADAAAQACGNAGGDAAARSRALDAVAAAHADTVAGVWCVAAGGEDAYGIARGHALVYASATLGLRAGDAHGPLAGALLAFAKSSQAAGEAALRSDGFVAADRLMRRLPDGRDALGVPFRAGPNSPDIAGVAGHVLTPVRDAALPWWLWTLPLLAAGLFVGLLIAAPIDPRASGGVAVTAALLAAVFGLPPIATPDDFAMVRVLAAEWIAPHDPTWRPFTGSADAWMDVVAVALGAALGTLGRGLGDVVRAARRDPGPYAYVGPAALATGLLVFVPFAMGVGLSFVSPGGDFVGLANFREIARSAVDAETSTHFFRTLAMTVLWTVTNVAVHVVFGLALALVLDRPGLRFRKGYRLLLVLPWAVPSYITALTWKWLFNTQYGPLNAMLQVLGVERVDWLGTSVATNFLANLATNVWLGFPFMMVVSLGALQSIPAELYEAAAIDGASARQRFRHITLPLLRPALFPAVILGTIWTFNAFNVIWLVSGGGPDHRTDILITEAYHAFAVLRRTGLAAAYSVLIFALLLGYTLVTNRLTKATENVAR